MERYKDMKIKKKANLKMIRNVVFFILLIVFTFWFIFKDQDINELIKNIKSTNKLYIIIAAIMGFLVYFIEAINVRSILLSLGEKKFSIFRAVRYTAIGAFFSAITPAATGGQPVEIYYMTKDKIKASNGTLAMLIQLCGFQISTLSFSIICAIIKPSLLSGGIIWLYLLGLLINGFALVIMLLSIFSSKMRDVVLKFLIKLMKALKVKNLEGKKEKLEETLNQYSESSVYIKSHLGTFIKAILRVFVMITIYHLIPFFVYKAFGLSGTTIFEMFIMQSILYTTVSGLPLPGAIGVSETLFLKIYGPVFGKNILSGAMLVYRFVSFYLYVILFLFVVIITSIKTKNIDGEIDNNIKEIEKDF